MTTRYEPPGGLPWGLYGLTGASLFLNAVFAMRFFMADPTDAVVVVESPTAVEQVAAIPAEAAATDDRIAALDIEAPPVEEEPAMAPMPEGVQTAELTVAHSLARTFQNGIGEQGDEVAAQVARLFVWDMDLRRDLQKGDVVEVAWKGAGPDLYIPVARYESRKLGEMFAYRFTAEGDTYASWWTEDGTEVARTLRESPMESYEQITSLLKDCPTHKGVDFKAPEGTAVLSARSGKVTRTNWNGKYNGNCVEVQYGDGTFARYLHLSSTDVEVGQRVGAGEAIGLSGNTGRSTAPHLHYELEKNGRVLDPVDYHGVTRRKLGSSDMTSFNLRKAELDAWLSDRS